MPNFNIKLLDIVFNIDCQYDYFYNLAKDYIADGNPQYFIRIKSQDIEIEKNKSELFNKEYGIEGSVINDDVFESNAILTKIVDIILEKNALVIHGAAVAKDNKGYLFIAPSGMGKTTHVSFWTKQYSDALIINGDKPIISVKDNKVFISGNPWAGRENLQTNITVPLKAICLLNRSDNNSISRLNDTDLIFQKLYGHVLRNNNEVLDIIRIIKMIIENVEFYSLECNDKIDASIVSYIGMNK